MSNPHSRSTSAHTIDKLFQISTPYNGDRQSRNHHRDVVARTDSNNRINRPSNVRTDVNVIHNVKPRVHQLLRESIITDESERPLSPSSHDYSSNKFCSAALPIHHNCHLDHKPIHLHSPPQRIRSYSDPDALSSSDRTSVADQLIADHESDARTTYRSTSSLCAAVHAIGSSGLQVHRFSWNEDRGTHIHTAGEVWLHNHRCPTYTSDIEFVAQVSGGGDPVSSSPTSADAIVRSNSSSLLTESLASRISSKLPIPSINQSSQPTESHQLSRSSLSLHRSNSQSKTSRSSSSLSPLVAQSRMISPSSVLSPTRPQISSSVNSASTHSSLVSQGHSTAVGTLPPGYITLYDLCYDLIHSQYGNTEVRDAFLLCVSYFSDPRVVVSVLLDFLFTPPPFPHTRILSFLQQWLLTFPNDLLTSIPQLLRRLTQFPPSHWKKPYTCQLKHMSDTLLACTQGLHHTLINPKPQRALALNDDVHPLDAHFHEHHHLDDEHSHLFDPAIAPPPNQLPILYMYSSKLIAHQLTSMALQRFSAITPRSLVRKHRSELKDSANQMKLSNAFSLFVSSEVLVCVDAKVRLAVFQKWIKIASMLYSLRNLNGCFEVMYGLTHHAVYRLRLFDLLMSDDATNYRTLCSFVSSDCNYGLYRRTHNALHRVAAERQSFVLPYLGVLMKDVVAMEEVQMVMRLPPVRRKVHPESTQHESLKSSMLGKHRTTSRDSSLLLRASIASTIRDPSSNHSQTSFAPSSGSSQSSSIAMSNWSSHRGSLSHDGTMPCGGTLSIIGRAHSNNQTVDSVECDLFGESSSLVLPMQLQPAFMAQKQLSFASNDDPTRMAVNFRQCREIHALIMTTLPPPSTFHSFNQSNNQLLNESSNELQRLILDAQHVALSEKELMQRSFCIQPKKK